MINSSAAWAAIGLVTTATFSATATAQDAWWYVGGHYSYTDFDQLGESDSGWSGTIGYEFNPTYAIEATYADLGRVFSGDGFASFAVTTVQLAGVGAFELSERVAMFGLLGYYRGDAEFRFAINTPTPFVEKLREDNYTYGIGIRFNLRRNIALRGTWQRYRKAGDITDIDTMNVGVVAKFGNR